MKATKKEINTFIEALTEPNITTEEHHTLRKQEYSKLGRNIQTLNKLPIFANIIDPEEQEKIIKKRKPKPNDTTQYWCIIEQIICQSKYENKKW